MTEEEDGFGYELGGDELRRVIAMSDSERLVYCLETCIETGQIWTIGEKEELIVLANEEDESFVVAFPHPDFAQDWFTSTDLEDADLVAVGTEDFANEILPSLEESEIKVLVFPTSEGEGSLTGAKSLAKLLSKS